MNEFRLSLGKFTAPVPEKLVSQITHAIGVLKSRLPQEQSQLSNWFRRSATKSDVDHLNKHGLSEVDVEKYDSCTVASHVKFLVKSCVGLIPPIFQDLLTVLVGIILILWEYYG
jgi:hypothetical protein